MNNRNSFHASRTTRCFVWLWGLLAAMGALQAAAQPPEAGKPRDRIACRNNPEQSYALYLPSDYAPDKKWPAIFIFDPAGRASTALELFIPAAEKYGYIAICSWNAKNGPSNLIHQAIWAVWNEARELYPLDSRRILSAGFSGGARAASLFHVLTQKSCAGIIACGAGLSLSIRDLPSIAPVYYYGIIGLSDFNYNEMAALAINMEKNNLPHHFHILDMEHAWPPAETLTAAVEWLEIDAMKKNLRPSDPALVQAVISHVQQRASQYELAGSPYFAARLLRNSENHLANLADTSQLTAKAAKLETSGEYRRFEEDEKRRNIREFEIRNDIHKTFQLLLNAPDIPPNPQRILDALHIKSLLKQLQKKERFYDAVMARRILSQLWIDASTRGGEFYAQKDWKRAAIFFEISAASGRQTDRACYNLACVYALDNQKKEAVKYLELAIKNGFTNKKHIASDPDLNAIHDDPAWEKLLQSLPDN